MKKIRFLSLETHLGVIFLLFLLLPTLSIAWLAYDYAIALTKSERVKTVGRVADMRREQLRMVFHRAIGRAERLLVDLDHRCDGPTRDAACLRDGLNFFLHSENALGVALLAPDASVLTVGESEVATGNIPSFKTGQLAQFTDYASGRRRTYYILIDDTHGKYRLAVTYPLQAIQSVFVSHPDLGNSGETFLADSQGFFITTARYPSTQGHSHPISATPMRRCLSPGNAETLDLDYRDVPIIHGFRFIDEIGGGCIMAHIDQAEAFAPLAALQQQMFAALLGFAVLAVLAALYFSRRISRPIRQLTLVTRNIATGELSARAAPTGYREVVELASSFNVMADRLATIHASLEQQVQQRTESLRLMSRVFQGSREGLCVTDENNDIIAINRAFSAMMGYDEAQAIGRNPRLLASGLTRKEDYAELWRALKDDGYWQGELWDKHKDGNIFPVWLAITALRDAQGRAVNYFASYNDISERKRAEQALRESEERWHFAIEGSGDGVWDWDMRGDETKFSARWKEILGYAETDSFPSSREWSQRFHPDDRALVADTMQAYLSGKTSAYFIECRMQCKDGSYKWVLGRGMVVERDADGQAVRMIGTTTDISARKRQEERTRQLLVENQTMLSNALVGIVYLKQRRIVSCNRRFEQLFRYEPGELIGESAERLYDTDENFLQAEARAYSTLGEAKSFSEELLLRHKDGSLFWGALNGCAIDPTHPLDGSIWIFADISERRRAEQERSKLLQAVEQSPASIVITDRNGVIEYVNPNFTRITGYSHEEAVGLTPRILKTPETPPETHRELWRTILDGKIWRGVLRNRCKNGALIWEETSISPIFNAGGEITHFVAVKEDVTERQRIEQQLEEYQAHLEDLVSQRTAELSAALEAAKLADRAKDEFLANITHELRTPLSAVIGFSALARPYCTDRQQREYLEKLDSAGKTLSSIIDDLLDLSKIVAGRLQLEERPFSLRQLVMRSSSVISYKATERGLTLIERIDDGIPDVLIGDSLRLEQILLNLLSNAVKFTSKGRVELRIGLERLDAPRVCLSIEVEDTGIGMREEEIALLFRPFAQADASMTRKFGGTGLGLAICKHLAESMGGDIGVVSRSGDGDSGSTFRARLWLRIGAADALSAATETAPEASLVQYQGARVLVVDDQPFNRDIVKGLLLRVGIVPHLANNGQEAIIVLTESKEPFDLVLMDVQMPIMDGHTATRAIRKMETFARLPIIAMTAHTMAHEREKSLAAGMSDHIGKPFDVVSFYRILATWISTEKQHRPVVAAPAPTEGARLSLPSLLGVDIQAGLALMMDDEARYRYWLGDFAQEIPAALQQLRHALDTGAPKQASAIAHALKGRTGLLGMKALHADAAALEAAIEEGAAADQLSAPLQAIERDVAAMCEEIRHGLGLNSDVTPTFAPLAELPAGELPPSLQRLIVRLQAGDSDSDVLVGDCLAEFETTAWAPRLRLALAHAKVFDFNAAIAVLSDGHS